MFPEANGLFEFPNGLKIGGNERPVIMAGPCSVEREIDGLLEVAYAAKEMGADIKLKAYVCFRLGEGLEKRNEDFAAEVASQLKK